MDGDRLRTLFSTIDAMDWDTLAGFFHPEAVYSRPGYPDLRGLDRIMHFYHAERAITSSEHTVEHTIVDGGLGAAWGRVSCVLTNGNKTEVGFADVYAFEGNLITERRTHFFVPSV